MCNRMLKRITVGLALCAAAGSAPSGATTFETSVLVSSDVAAADDFGTAVAIDGTTMVAGAPFADVGGNSAQGAAYVFELSGGSWTQVQKLTAGDGTTNDLFGWSVAISGDRIVIGAEEANVGPNDAQGAAYIFERSGGSWVQAHKLSEATTIQNQAEYGAAVAVQGDRVVVGAPAAASAQHGRAFIYQRDEGGPAAWGLVAELEDDIYDTNAGFGASVALDGDFVVVGARMLDRAPGTYLNEGGAYVFQLDEFNYWTQVGKLFRTGAADNERAGTAVAIEGTRIVVGAYAADAGGLDRGAAYVFENPSLAADGWVQVAELIADDGGDNDHFGTSIALRDGNAWVGATGHDGSAGRAYRFAVDQGGPGAWGQAEAFGAAAPAVNDWLGKAIAVSATSVAIGAFGAGTGGAVLVYAGPGGGTSAVDRLVPDAPVGLVALPNPFNPATRLRFAVEREGRFEIDVRDLRGALVERVFTGRLPAGDHEIEWRADGLASGVYLANVRGMGSSRTVRLTLVK